MREFPMASALGRGSGRGGGGGAGTSVGLGTPGFCIGRFNVLSIQILHSLNVSIRKSGANRSARCGNGSSWAPALPVPAPRISSKIRYNVPSGRLISEQDSRKLSTLVRYARCKLRPDVKEGNYQERGQD